MAVESEKSCLFCELGKKPENIIYENDLFYSQFDKFPVSPGHAEVIPKKHIKSLMDLTPEEWNSLQEALRETVHLIEAIDLREVYSTLSQKPVNEKSLFHMQKMLDHPGIDCIPDGYNFGNNDGEAAGRTIHHLHIHIIPRFKGDVENPRGGIRNIIPDLGNY